MTKHRATYALGGLAVLAILVMVGLKTVPLPVASTCSSSVFFAHNGDPSCAQVAAVATQIAGTSTSEGQSDNCGQVNYWSGADGNELDEPLSAARESETCLWQHYQRGRRAMLLVRSIGESDAPNVTTLVTIDPADHATLIHVARMEGDVSGSVSASTDTCRALLSTPSGVQVDGCSPTSTADPNQTLQDVQGAIQRAEQDQQDQTATARQTATAH